ncbi:MAG: prepilin peptidase [Sphingobium sp.]|nr:prepilin peptidase [Sphingobium sp.]
MPVLAPIPAPVVALSALLALMLLYGAATDLRARIISNRLNLAIALLAPLWWWATGLSPWPGIALQIGVAAGVFALFSALFAIGMMGGGDVKMLGALALWLPWQALVTLLVVMALAGGLITLATVIHHRVAQKDGQPEVPYGVAIALAGLWVLGERYLNPFL